HQQVSISWITASETNNDYFTVEKSKDGNFWLSVDKVIGAGNSTAARYYETNDPDPFEGTSYYRLKQTDFDGKFSYSDVSAVRVDEKNTIIIYPNPASDLIMIEAMEINSFDFSVYSSI